MRHGVILAGGGGVRLWPASRRARPKQILPLGEGGETLLGAARRRAERVVDQVMVVTAASQEAGVTEVLGSSARVIAEPVGRNTAAAIGLAAVHVAATDPDGVLIVFPSDHHVGDEATFARVAGQALEIAAATGSIVSIGVQPTRAETGFGYIELGAARPDGARAVVRFVEKPDQARAQAMVAGGTHLWNAGIFAAPASRLLADIERHLPDTHRALTEVRLALASGGEAAASARAQAVYPLLPSVSIDHGVLEKLTDLLCVGGDFGWNDVGAWSALAEIARADGDGNVARGQLVAVDARRNITVSDPGRLIALVGVEDLIVVQSGDALLVIPRARAQEVRAAVSALEQAGLDRFL